MVTLRFRILTICPSVFESLSQWVSNANLSSISITCPPYYQQLYQERVARSLARVSLSSSLNVWTLVVYRRNDALEMYDAQAVYRTDTVSRRSRCPAGAYGCVESWPRIFLVCANMLGTRNLSLAVSDSIAGTSSDPDPSTPVPVYAFWLAGLLDICIGCVACMLYVFSAFQANRTENLRSFNIYPFRVRSPPPHSFPAGVANTAMGNACDSSVKSPPARGVTPGPARREWFPPELIIAT